MEAKSKEKLFKIRYNNALEFKRLDRELKEVILEFTTLYVHY